MLLLLVDPNHYETRFPYNWQNVRFYSIQSPPPIWAGGQYYKIVLSFKVLNYNQLDEPGYVNPAALSFVADMYYA